MKIKNLEYFIGKPCTIFTRSINRNFKEENPNTFPEQPHHYFVGIIENVDDFGVFVTQVLTGLKSYFFLTGIVAIAEESILDPDVPEDAQIIDKIKLENESAKEQFVPEKFFNANEMTNMLKNIKEKQ